MDTSGFALGRADLTYREVHLMTADLETGIYFACAVDSVTQAGSSFLTLNINNGDIGQGAKDDNVLYPPTGSNVHLAPIKGTPYSDCSFGGISLVSSNYCKCFGLGKLTKKIKFLDLIIKYTNLLLS